MPKLTEDISPKNEKILNSSLEYTEKYEIDESSMKSCEKSENEEDIPGIKLCILQLFF